MLRFFSRIFKDFKEYIVTVILLIISLLLISLNDKPAVKNIRTLAFGNIAVINSLLDDLITGKEDPPDAELRKRNAELMLQVNKYRDYKRENEKLKEMLALKDTTEFPLHPASVISRTISIAQGNAIINAGASDSIQTGMPVINDKGLVGLVTNVAEDFSAVRLLQNSDLKVSVKNQRSGVDGILTWNGINLLIKNIPTTYDFEIGDRVITSDFSTIMPPSIPVGLITEKETTVSGLLSNIIVTPFVDFSSIDHLFVVKIVPSSQVDSLELNLFRK